VLPRPLEQQLAAAAATKAKRREDEVAEAKAAAAAARSKAKPSRKLQKRLERERAAAVAATEAGATTLELDIDAMLGSGGVVAMCSSNGGEDRAPPASSAEAGPNGRGKDEAEEVTVPEDFMLVPLVRRNKEEEDFFLRGTGRRPGGGGGGNKAAAAAAEGSGCGRAGESGCEEEESVVAAAEEVVVDAVVPRGGRRKGKRGGRVLLETNFTVLEPGYDSQEASTLPPILQSDAQLLQQQQLQGGSLSCFPALDELETAMLLSMGNGREWDGRQDDVVADGLYALKASFDETGAAREP
jgi:hypothetical protein